jgi:hypothetical protein
MEKPSPSQLNTVKPMRPRKLLLTLFFLASTTAAEGLSPFTTDGCSLFPDGTATQHSLWVHCCIRHDLAYWKGGTAAERLDADKALEQCVSQTGEPEIAQLMLAGVRVGGAPLSPMPYRWGYGWPLLRGYKALTAAEQQEVNQQLTSFETIIKSIYQELHLDDRYDDR